ncbi:MAG: hypothetical protein EZS28_045155, partial [Streblomastix strix]
RWLVAGTRKQSCRQSKLAIRDEPCSWAVLLKESQLLLLAISFLSISHLLLSFYFRKCVVHRWKSLSEVLERHLLAQHVQLKCFQLFYKVGVVLVECRRGKKPQPAKKVSISGLGMNARTRNAFLSSSYAEGLCSCDELDYYSFSAMQRLFWARPIDGRPESQQTIEELTISVGGSLQPGGI